MKKPTRVQFGLTVRAADLVDALGAPPPPLPGNATMSPGRRDAMFFGRLSFRLIIALALTGRAYGTVIDVLRGCSDNPFRCSIESFLKPFIP